MNALRTLISVAAFTSLFMIAGPGCCAQGTNAKPEAQGVQSKAPDQTTPPTVMTFKTLKEGELKMHIFYPANHDPAKPRPVAVFFFGGGWVGGNPSQFFQQCRYLAGRGMVAMSAEYRVEAKHHTLPTACVEDGKSAIRWIRKNAKMLGVDPNQILAGGGSAGGHVAAAAATLSSYDDPSDDLSISCVPNALALFNPVFDNGPGGYGYDRVKDYWQNISPMHNLSKKTPPTIAFFGTNDEYVPVSTMKKYKEKMEQLDCRCELYLYEGQPHGFFNKHENFLKTMEQLDPFLVSLGFLEKKKDQEINLTQSPPVNHARRMPPNIVWLMAEDCSKHWYELFDPVHGKATPNIESMADSGLIFNNAYCNVAVCSAARSTLISGCYPSRIGVQWHRRATVVNLPAGLSAFPTYLRQAGYYTTNSTSTFSATGAAKTDFNCNVSDVWDRNIAGDEFGWRNRPTSETPFFHVRTLYESHESNIQTSAEIANPKTDLNSVQLYSVHPDTTTFRNTYATYFDRIKDVDNGVGRIISALQADGLLEDTFIFFFGDNGGTVAGSKGYIGNTGLNVPLVVRIPQHWQHLAPTSPDGQVNGFVSYEDFGATVLHLAGLAIPGQMDGEPFLGSGVTLADINANDEAFCSTDRFDEQYNLCRSLQKGNLKYVRNYEPFYPYALYNEYRYVMEAQKEWETKFDAGQLNAAQREFFESRSAEELYDIASDPFETNNLATHPAYASTLADLRRRLRSRMTGMPDVGILPEAVFLSEGGTSDGAAYGQANQARITRYIDIADLMLDSYANVSAHLATHLASSDPLDRFWAMTVCAAFGTDAAGMQSTVTSLVATESNPLVLARAAVFLGELSSSTAVVENALKSGVTHCSDKTESLLVLNDAVHLQDTLGYNFTTISSGNVVGTSSWLTNRISHLGW
jgi:arylsulfatase A-like enzyme/acetyl esterase/lipase